MSLPALAPAGATPPRPPPAVPSVAPAVPSIAPAGPGVAPLAAGPRAPSGTVPSIPSVAPIVPPIPPAAATAATPSRSTGPDLDAQQLADLEARCSRLDQLDYFEVLMLEKTATPADIKRAFYRESRTYHPDRFFQVDSRELKERINDLYKRVTEAYYVLRDDSKRKKYVTDVTGPERAQKLRFTEASEAETKAAAKKEQEEQIGTHPKGRQFFQQAQRDADAGNWAAAERNLKMALTYEPANARYKERLAEVQKQSQDESRDKGGSFKIR
ncbi:molecular chaperone DnaJ [Corallococcus macrosporus DSM 14697]|uniref:Molecular chaperone DnaJ n=2 Tax=Corallococcus macrosporus TaxID=35 RepID=A0A250JTT7_9BACT|nr:molecular chaperone DnaJ [Corallococcus macrosporus DSM 14697]